MSVRVRGRRYVATAYDPALGRKRHVGTFVTRELAEAARDLARDGNWDEAAEASTGGRAGFVPVALTGCWLWRGAIAENGYGRAMVEGRSVAAHREVYERLRGPIAEGLTLDHLCFNRACVNPDHLEAVTPTENARRAADMRARFLPLTTLPANGEPA